MLGRRGRGALPNTASATTGLVGESMLASVLLGYTTFSSDILNKGASGTAKASERRQKGRENSLEVAQRRSVFYDTGWRNDTLAIAEMNPNCVGNLAAATTRTQELQRKRKGRRMGGEREAVRKRRPGEQSSTIRHLGHPNSHMQTVQMSMIGHQNQRKKRAKFRRDAENADERRGRARCHA